MSTFPSDIEIAQAANIRHIKEVAADIGLSPDDIEYYGKHKAKMLLKLIDEEKLKKNHLVSWFQPSPQHLPAKEKQPSPSGLQTG
jgi:formate--tetrahydrofolate ligase